MPDVSAADQVAVVDAAIQAAELGLASLASVADKAPLLAPGAKHSDTREADTREEGGGDQAIGQGGQNLCGAFGRGGQCAQAATPVAA